jgi:hypothetical protein
MLVSFNELDAMVRKAFRGAGYHWGEAEEAGKAALWLARHGFDVALPLLALMRQADECGMAALRTGALCPVCVGTALADRAQELGTRGELEFTGLLSPMVLLPFAAAASTAAGCPLAIAWEGCDIFVDGAEIQTGAIDGLAKPSAEVRLRVMPRGHRIAWPAMAPAHSASVEPVSWDALNAYAFRTYVPASDQSRIAGAGAGLSDND